MLFFTTETRMRVGEASPEQWQFAYQLYLGYDPALPIDEHLRYFDEAVAEARADIRACLQDLQAVRKEEAKG